MMSDIIGLIFFIIFATICLTFIVPILIVYGIAVLVLYVIDKFNEQIRLHK